MQSLVSQRRPERQNTAKDPQTCPRSRGRRSVRPRQISNKRHDRSPTACRLAVPFDLDGGAKLELLEWGFASLSTRTENAARLGSESSPSSSDGVLVGSQLRELSRNSSDASSERPVHFTCLSTGKVRSFRDARYLIRRMIDGPANGGKRKTPRILWVFREFSEFQPAPLSAVSSPPWRPSSMTRFRGSQRPRAGRVTEDRFHDLRPIPEDPGDLTFHEQPIDPRSPGDVVRDFIRHQCPGLMRLKRVPMNPFPVRPPDLLVDEFVRRFPAGDFRAPADRNSPQSQAVIDECPLAHLDRKRREDPKVQPIGRQSIEIASIREERKYHVRRSRQQLLRP